MKISIFSLLLFLWLILFELSDCSRIYIFIGLGICLISGIALALDQEKKRAG